MKCEKCNTEMICDETKILTSYPPKRQYNCPKCGNVGYRIIDFYGGNNE